MRISGTSQLKDVAKKHTDLDSYKLVCDMSIVLLPPVYNISVCITRVDPVSRMEGHTSDSVVKSKLAIDEAHCILEWPVDWRRISISVHAGVMILGQRFLG